MNHTVLDSGVHFKLGRAEVRIEYLREALRLAIDVIGHPDDGNSKYLARVLESTDLERYPLSAGMDGVA